MPVLKSDALPVPPAEVESIRARLEESYSYEVVERDGARYLFLRAASEVPHPIHDFEGGLEGVAPWDLQQINDVFLLGSRQDLHVPGSIARPVIDARLRNDLQLARGARGQLDVQYGVRLLRIVGDPVDEERLFVRVPRDRCADVTEADLVALAERIGPLHDAGSLKTVRTCFLLAEGDHLRFRARDFVADMADRWLPLKEKRLAARRPAEVAAPSVRTVVDVTPALVLDAELNAQPDITVSDDGLRRAEAEVREVLADHGYAFATATQLGDTPFALQASRKTLFPNSVAVAVRSVFDRVHADEALRLVREYALDLLVVVSAGPTEDALRRVAASKVKVIKPDKVAEFRP